DCQKYKKDVLCVKVFNKKRQQEINFLLAFFIKNFDTQNIFFVFLTIKNSKISWHTNGNFQELAA
ncbi:MAG: hypothetical protein J6Y82_00690, partial [Bacteroidales bacterium]|nr:hypothetical protein [Bacteroidales bacterium]